MQFADLLLQNLPYHSDPTPPYPTVRAFPTVRTMKGLPYTCCQCGIALSLEAGRRPLELYCDCLVSLCRDCGVAQVVRHCKPKLGSYIECPVCRSKETNTKNGYVDLAPVVHALRERNDNFLRFPDAPKTKDKKHLLILARMYLKCGFADGMEGEWVEGVKGMGISQLELYIARCEAHLQRIGYAPDKGAPPVVGGVVGVGGALDQGPLQHVVLKENLVLVKVLGLLEEQGWGQQEEGALSWLWNDDELRCYLCFEDLVPGNTVRGRCHCCSKACQLCTRRSVKNLRPEDKSAPVKCSLCRTAILSKEETREAKANQDELVLQLIAERSGNPRSHTRALKLQVCWDIRHLTTIPSDFRIMGDGWTEGMREEMDADTFLNLDEGKVNLSLAQVKADLVRREALQRRAEKTGCTTVASASDYRPIGPVGRLYIRRDLFLECVLRAMGQGQTEKELQAESGVPYSQLYLPDPEAWVDETKPVMKFQDAPGGELQLEVGGSGGGELEVGWAGMGGWGGGGGAGDSGGGRGGGEVCLETDPLTNLLRHHSTPCPHIGCTVDPHCPHYLAQHVYNYHGAGVKGKKGRVLEQRASDMCVEVVSDDDVIPITPTTAPAPAPAAPAPAPARIPRIPAPPGPPALRRITVIPANLIPTATATTPTATVTTATATTATRAAVVPASAPTRATAPTAPTTAGAAAAVDSGALARGAIAARGGEKGWEGRWGGYSGEGREGREGGEGRQREEGREGEGDRGADRERERQALQALQSPIPRKPPVPVEEDSSEEEEEEEEEGVGDMEQLLAEELAKASINADERDRQGQRKGQIERDRDRERDEGQRKGEADGLPGLRRARGLSDRLQMANSVWQTHYLQGKGDRDSGDSAGGASGMYSGRDGGDSGGGSGGRDSRDSGREGGIEGGVAYTLDHRGSSNISSSISSIPSPRPAQGAQTYPPALPPTAPPTHTPFTTYTPFTTPHTPYTTPAPPISLMPIPDVDADYRALRDADTLKYEIVMHTRYVGGKRGKGREAGKIWGGGGAGEGGGGGGREGDKLGEWDREQREREQREQEREKLTLSPRTFRLVYPQGTLKHTAFGTPLLPLHTGAGASAPTSTLKSTSTSGPASASIYVPASGSGPASAPTSASTSVADSISAYGAASASACGYIYGPASPTHSPSSTSPPSLVTDISVQSGRTELVFIGKQLRLPKYGFRGVIMRWRGRGGNQVCVKDTFADYDIESGSTIELVLLPPPPQLEETQDDREVAAVSRVLGRLAVEEDQRRDARREKKWKRKHRTSKEYARADEPTERILDQVHRTAAAVAAAAGEGAGMGVGGCRPLPQFQSQAQAQAQLEAGGAVMHYQQEVVEAKTDEEAGEGWGAIPTPIGQDIKPSHLDPYTSTPLPAPYAAPYTPTPTPMLSAHQCISAIVPEEQLKMHRLYSEMCVYDDDDYGMGGMGRGGGSDSDRGSGGEGWVKGGRKKKKAPKPQVQGPKRQRGTHF